MPQQAGVRADAYAQQIVNSGALGSLMSDIMRGKALALVMERATITDASGRPVDLDKLQPARAHERWPATTDDQTTTADDRGRRSTRSRTTVDGAR